VFKLANTVYTLKYIYGVVIQKVVVTLLLLLLWIDWNRLALKLVPFYFLRPYKLLTVLKVGCISVCSRLLPSPKAVWGFDFRPEIGWSVHMFVWVSATAALKFWNNFTLNNWQCSTHALLKWQGYWWIVIRSLEYSEVMLWHWNWGAKVKKNRFQSSHHSNSFEPEPVGST